MAQGIQRDPLSIASGGLPGLYGVTFSPLPPTEGDVAARRMALVPQFSGAPASIMSTPIFRPTAQAALPTPLLLRPEEIGRAAFRPVLEESQFPALRPAETIEEIDQRLSAALPSILPAPSAPVQAPNLGQPSGTESVGSIFEAPDTQEPGTPALSVPVSATGILPSVTQPRWSISKQPKSIQTTSLTLPPPPPPPQTPSFTLQAVVDSQENPLYTILKAL
jgi:hypothetical protein